MSSSLYPAVVFYKQKESSRRSQMSFSDGGQAAKMQNLAGKCPFVQPVIRAIADHAVG